MTIDDFRRIALSMEGAVESAHMGHPDFRAGGRIFATIWPKQRWGMAKLALEDQAKFIERHPTVFQAVSGGWGRMGCTHVYLENADEEMVKLAVTAAWGNTVAKSKAKKKKSR